MLDRYKINRRKNKIIAFGFFNVLNNLFLLYNILNIQNSKYAIRSSISINFIGISGVSIQNSLIGCSIFKPDEAILCSDEAGIQLDPTIAAQWAPKVCQPQLFSGSTRERVNLCGIVDIKTRGAMVQKISKGNAQNFILFMQWLIILYSKYSRIWLYVDNARWHKAQIVKDYLTQQNTIIF